MAQKELITLKNSLIRVPDQKFYIRSVIDGRVDVADIGFVHQGSFNKKLRVDLKDGVEPALQSFYTYALKVDSSLIPIAIRVVFFQVSERTDGPSEIGKAELKVEFYRRNDSGQWGKVYETEAQAEEVAPDVTSGHERRIRKVLENVLLAFNNSNWTMTQPSSFVDFNQIKGQRSALLDKSLEPVKNSWVSLLGGHAAFGTNAEGWGGFYMGYLSSHKGNWAIPFSVAYDKYTVDPGLVIRAGYQKINLNYVKVGIGAMKKIGEDFHFLFNANVPFGIEELEKENLDADGNKISTTVSDRLVFGFEPSQSFYFISRSRVGFFLGAGIYERFLSSKIYKNDIGFKIEAGLKF
jgi:hypothetical protein